MYVWRMLYNKNLFVRFVLSFDIPILFLSFHGVRQVVYSKWLISIQKMYHLKQSKSCFMTTGMLVYSKCCVHFVFFYYIRLQNKSTQKRKRNKHFSSPLLTRIIERVTDRDADRQTSIAR